MEQTVLSINDDKMTTRGELIEYPAELIGGRNYFREGAIRGHGSSWVYQGYTLEGAPVYLNEVTNPNASNNFGILLSENIPLVSNGGDFVLSFWVNVMLFEHNRGLSGYFNLRLKDGNSQRVYVSVPDYRGLELDTWTKIEVKFNAGSPIEAITAFFIWSDFVIDGSVLYTYPKLEKGTKATDWTPAPEDFGLSYPDWVTEFKPSINENGILTPEFDESGVLSFSINRTTAQEFIENPNL